MSEPFYVSITSMNSFYTCHAQYNFRQRWNSKETAQFFIDGKHAHEALEGIIPETMSMDALSYYNKLLKLRESLGYDVFETEVRQEVQLSKDPDIRLIRVVDGIAELDGKVVLVDYKTASYPWKEITKGLAGKGNTFQAPAYLIPPFEGEEWADEIHFLVAPLRQGGAKRYVFKYDEEAHQNFIQAVQFMYEHHTSTIKHRGIACDFCGFAPMCYDVDGWEKLYTPKGERP